MLTKDAAETTGAVGEAPTLVVVLCLYLAAPVVLPTIAQTLLEFGIKCFFAFPDRCQFDNCSFKSSALPSSNFFHRSVSSNASVPLKGRNLPSGSSTICDSGTGWSAGQLKDIL